MKNSSRIFNGCRVEGSFGLLVTNPNPNVKRRIRSKANGTVLGAAGAHTWDITFDFDGNLKTVNSRSLVVVPVDSGIPLDEETISNAKYVSYHNRLNLQLYRCAY